MVKGWGQRGKVQGIRKRLIADPRAPAPERKLYTVFVMRDTRGTCVDPCKSVSYSMSHSDEREIGADLRKSASYLTV